MRSPQARPRSHSATRTLLAALSLAAPAFVHAADFYKANNETVLDLIAAWENADGSPVAAAPANSTTSTDTWIWDSRVTAAADVGLDGIHNVTVGTGKDLGVRTIRITNPALPVLFNGNARTFTPTTTGGIDMASATQDFTLQNMFYRVAASSAVLSMNVASGRTLTFGDTAQVTVRSNGSNVLVNLNTDGVSTGTIAFNNIFNPSHVVIGGGRVEFNNPTGTSRIATASPNPPSYTDVNAGTLVVNNTSGSATGASTVNIKAGATFTGSGSVSGVVTASAGSTLIPGLSGVGTLGTGSLVLSAADGPTPATKIIWEATNAASADLINVSTSGGLTINGGVVYLYNPGTTDPLTATGTFEFINYTGAIGGAGLGALSIHPSTMLEGRTYILGFGAKGVTLRIINGALVQRSWDVDASASWSTAANWTDDTVPDAASIIANITGPAGATLTAPRTVTLDAPRTVGQLLLDSAQPVTVDGASTLTLNDDGNSATLSSVGANHTISAPLALTSGGVLASVDDTRQLTLSGVISGTGFGLVKTGPGTLRLTANNTYTGATSVSVGTLQIGDGGASGSVAGPISTSTNTTLRFNRTGAFDLAFPISGNGSVEFLGSADRTLSATNTYSGPTTLSAGTLVIANGLALQNSTLDYTTTGGSLVVADGVTAVTLGGLSGNRPFPLTNTSAVPLALTVGGNNSGPLLYSASPLGTGASFTKTGTGALSLTGTHAYSGALTVTNGPLNLNAGANFSAASVGFGSNATAKLTVDAATLNISGALTLNNASAGFALANGALATIGGAITNTASDTGANFIHVNGGSTLNAASISLRRGSANSTTEPTGGSTANGLHIQNGTVNLTGALSLGILGAGTGTNSNVSGRIDAGALNVAGPVNVVINSPDRWTILDINGGAFTSTNTDQGVYLGGDTAAGNVVFLVRGSGVANVPRFQFSKDALAGKSYLNLSGGTLYVGSGGMVVGSTNPALDARLRLGNGTLGATADWSSPVPITLQGVPTVLTGADASDTPHTITLSGVASGSGQLSKTGSGTVLLTNPANIYADTVTIDGGTLGLAGTANFGITVNTAGALQPVGVLTSGFGATIEGRLSITYDGSNATTPVSRLESGSTVVLGASSSLKVTGTGNLPGPAYTIITGGVSGTFATVDLPAGLTVNYDYDDDNNAGTPGVVALVGSISASPYDAWTTSFSLTGNDALASADPDGDGLANLLEFAFSSSPVAANSAPWTIARSGNFLTLSFNHPANSGLSYSVEAVNDLTGTWAPVHSFPTFTTAGTATYTDTVDLSNAATRRFLRLKITPAP